VIATACPEAAPGAVSLNAEGTPAPDAPDVLDVGYAQVQTMSRSTSIIVQCIVIRKSTFAFVFLLAAAVWFAL
jgi:hypothetical protein